MADKEPTQPATEEQTATPPATPDEEQAQENTLEIPEFKSTEEAIAFLDKIQHEGTPEQKELLEKAVFGTAENEEEEEEEKTDTPTQEPAPKPDEEAQGADAPKVFKVRYRGTELLRPDENGLLGFETTGHLKRAFIQRDAELDAIRQQRETDSKELAALREKYEAISKPREAQPQPTQQAPSGSPTQQPGAQQTSAQSPAEPIKRPKPPTYPELSSNDPAEYSTDDVAKIARYNQERVEYDSAMDKYLEYRETAAVDVPQDVREKLAAYDDLRAKTDKLLQKVEADEHRAQAEAEERQYWDRFANYQGMHKEFSTETPIQQLHTQVINWMDQLASAHGHTKPLDQSSPEYQKYLDTRATIAGAYRQGNEKAREVAEQAGLQPPKESERYFQLADQVSKLERRREEYIQAGELGKNASLHRVHLMLMDESGELENGIDAVRREERVKSAEATAAALQESQQYAKTAPNETIHQEVAPADLNQQDLQWFMSINGLDVLRLNAEDRKRYDRIAGVVSQRAQLTM